MQKILLELTDELANTVDIALKGRRRNPTIEEWLWSVPEIRSAAKSAGIVKKWRPGPGRPQNKPA